MPATCDPRSLRLALAGSEALHHAVACRLGAALESWSEHGAGPPDPALAHKLGVPAPALALALALRGRTEVAAARLERAAAAEGARVATLGEPGYPAAFAVLDLPPPAVWIAGELDQAPAVALVGARRASPYGVEIARWLARGAAEGGATVVSGFAVGIDAAAHRGALDASQGRTVAVLGCGLGVDYPRGHRQLGERIRRQGALVTEFAPRTSPRGWQFPVRNRLIAALARAVVVVEGAPRSGSLITARLALELGRELLAVPGRLTDELSLAPNALVADGAAPALLPDDLLDAVGLAEATRRAARRAPGAAGPEPPPGLDEPGRALWLAASDGPAPPEALAARAGLAIDRALAHLLTLELTGHLRRAPDGTYAPPG